MPELKTTSRLPYAVMCIMSVTIATTALPPPSITLALAALTRGERGYVSPSSTLSEWVVSTLSLRDGTKTGLKMNPGRREQRVEASGSSVKRSIVADDAAFKERSKLLTSLERQKWLNSYMQKLLVVNSSA